MKLLRWCVVCLLLCIAAYWLSCATSRAQTQSVDLRQGAQEFVKLIEKRDSSQLLGRISEQGTSFIGTAYVPAKASLSPEEIRRDFENKTGVYCLFFDTDCFRKEDSAERTHQSGHPLVFPLRSIAELLSTAKKERFVTYDINGKNGKVSVLLSDKTPDTARIGEDAVNLYFRMEDGVWKLRNVEYN